MDTHLQTAVFDVLAELQDALLHLLAVVRPPHIFEKGFGILLQRGLVVAEEHTSCVLRLTEEVVDVDAYQDAHLLDTLQLAAQLEIARRTKIANHGVEDVEVGHCRGDAVELVHQRRVDVVEKLGTHKAWRISA